MRLLGQDFQCWRATWESAQEATAAGYPAESAEYAERHAAPTFRTYLVAMTGAGWPMSGAAPRRPACPL